RRQVRARQAGLELLARLGEARLQGAGGKDGKFGDELIDGLYAQVFHDAGLDLEALSVEEAVARLHATTVAAELAATLDHWALVRLGRRGPEDPSWRHLLSVARGADPGQARRRVREALARRDRQALLEVVSSEDASRLLPRTMGALATIL